MVAAVACGCVLTAPGERSACVQPGISGQAAAAPGGPPAAECPYSFLLAGDFTAPRKRQLDESYGVEGRLLLRAGGNFFIGPVLSYARVKNEDLNSGLIEGELQRYETFLWTEYRLGLARPSAWTPSLDLGIGPGWLAARPAPSPERKEQIEAANFKFDSRAISTPVFRLSVQLRVPVARSNELSIYNDSADVVIGVGADFGEGKAKYTLTDHATGAKTHSRGTLMLDAFHAFFGVSFWF